MIVVFGNYIISWKQACPRKEADPPLFFNDFVAKGGFSIETICATVIC